VPKLRINPETTSRGTKMSLVKTIGELSDYANSVGGLLRLKRREEKWVPIDEWIALNLQVKQSNQVADDALQENRELSERLFNEQTEILQSDAKITEIIKLLDSFDKYYKSMEGGCYPDWLTHLWSVLK
jgi:hypothetical protein